MSRSFKGDEGKQYFFCFRLGIYTTNGGFTCHAAESFIGQAIPASVLHLVQLAEMPIDWEELDKGISGTKAITEYKEVILHQQDALNEAKKYYKEHDRGKIRTTPDFNPVCFAPQCQSYSLHGF